MKNNFSKENFNKMVDVVKAVSTISEYYCYFTKKQVQSIPEYFYQDIDGQWWFETPWTCKQKVVLIPDEALGDKCLFIKKEEIDGAIEKGFNNGTI